MRNVNIIVSIMVALTAATAGAIKNVPPAPRRVFIGVNLGMAGSSAQGNRVAASGRGAAISGDFGYLATPSLVVPYVTGGAAWGRSDAPEWEREGYASEAWYMGLLAEQLTVGALYRHPVAGPRLHAYGGPAFLAVWQRHEVQDTFGLNMETTRGSGLGWAIIAGAEFRPGPGQAVGLQGVYGRAYSNWSGLPAAADEGFTFTEFQISGFLRFFI
jgi:opacity protein-like surface antigen